MSDLANKYPAHVEHVKKLTDEALMASGFDSVLIAGGNLKYIFLDDMPYPFKVNPHLAWWAPVTDNPNCWIYYEMGEEPVFIFNRPIDYWHDAASEPDDYWVNEFDLRLVATPDEVRGQLPRKLRRTAYIGEDSEQIASWGARAFNPDRLMNYLHHNRAAKSEWELASMREASIIGARGHKAAEKAFFDGASEFEIHLAYLAAAGLMEHELPYGNIIALNEHGAVLHYHALKREQPSQRLSFLIDAGGQFNGYASDITRTHTTDEDFGTMIKALDKIQLELCADVKPGKDYKELHVDAHLKLAGLLKEFGVIKVSADEAVSSGINSAFFPHGLGHLIGLQTHDVGGFSANVDGDTIDKPEGHPYLRLTRVIEKDWVMTIEPGVYFIDQLLDPIRNGEQAGMVDWSVVDRYKPYGGIRIEDNVRATTGQPENLTRDAFSSI